MHGQKQMLRTSISPQWLRSLTTIALIIGVVSTVTQVLALRFDLPAVEAQKRAMHDAECRKDFAHRVLFPQRVTENWLHGFRAMQLCSSIRPMRMQSFRWSISCTLRIRSSLPMTRMVADRSWEAIHADVRFMSAALEGLFNGATADEAREHLPAIWNSVPGGECLRPSVE